MYRSLLIPALAAGLLTAPAALAQPTLLANLPTIDGPGGTATFLNGFTIEGTTGYFTLTGAGGNAHHVTRLTNLGGANTFTDLVSNTNYKAVAASPDSGLGGGVIYVSGGNLYVADTTSDEVYTIDKSSGAMSVLLSEATMDLDGGSPNANPLAMAPGAGGLPIVAESTLNNLLQATGTNTVSTVRTAAQLTAIAGSSGVNGMTTSGSTIFWGNNTPDAVFQFNTATVTGGTALTTAQITAATGSATAGFGNLSFFTAPNGRIYFYETVSDSILSFLPANPAATLQVDFNAAALGSLAPSVTALGWFDNRVAFSVGAGASAGVYTIPEPATFTALGLAALGLVARRRRAA